MDVLKQVASTKFQHALAQCLLASLALIALTLVCNQLRLNLATASLLFLIVIVVLARAGRLVSSVVASVVAALCLAYVAPPRGSVLVDDPFDVVAIAALLITSLLIVVLVFKLRRMTEDALSSVDRRLVDAEERERAWIARELHDDVNQRMALLSINLERLQQDFRSLHPAARKRFREIVDRVSSLAIDVQALAHRLHSSKLEYLGLAVAAKSLCKELSEKHGAEIEVHSEGVPKSLPQSIARSLFRVLQEALQNAVKHSGSGHFKVRLSGVANSIELSVHDGGIGFDPEAAMKGKGLGLISMQERIKMVKGEFSIASQVRRGTTIHARVPLGTRHAPARKASVMEMLRSVADL